MASSTGILFSPGVSDLCVLMVTMWAQCLGFRVIIFTESLCLRLCNRVLRGWEGMLGWVAVNRGCKDNLLLKWLVEKWQINNTFFLLALKLDTLVKMNTEYNQLVHIWILSNLHFQRNNFSIKMFSFICLHFVCYMFGCPMWFKNYWKIYQQATLILPMVKFYIFMTSR